jgi:hypothetical protein
MNQGERAARQRASRPTTSEPTTTSDDSLLASNEGTERPTSQRQGLGETRAHTSSGACGAAALRHHHADGTSRRAPRGRPIHVETPAFSCLYKDRFAALSAQAWPELGEPRRSASPGVAGARRAQAWPELGEPAVGTRPVVECSTRESQLVRALERPPRSQAARWRRSLLLAAACCCCCCVRSSCCCVGWCCCLPLRVRESARERDAMGLAGCPWRP